MALTIGQVTTTRLLVRSVVKNAFDIENALDELLEKQQGNIKGLQQDLDGLLQLVKAASGSLVEQVEDPKPEAPAAAPAPAAEAAPAAN
jgi:hypothetical protein